MTELKRLSAGLIAAAMLATTVMARKHHVERAARRRTLVPAQHPPGVSNHVRDYIS
jgi:hypothetical protein